jgi:hypothetical protein
LGSNPFDDNRLCGARSALLKMSPDNQGRFEFELACQYTRSGLNQLQVGDLIGVENYTTSDNGDRTYSILTLTEVVPVHFAAQGTGAYPGHIFESMRSIKDDWEVQNDKPLHATTTITTRAVSTGWQFQFNPRYQELPSLSEEMNLPMVGAEIRPLSMEMVNKIINQGLETQQNSPLIHNKFKKINIKLDKESLLTTHFGIFGFTGVGKSNLVSSLVFSLSSKDSSSPSNVVIVDPNDEYLGLLIDKFGSDTENVLYVHAEPDSLPNMVIENLGKNENDISPQAVDFLFRQMKLPSKLKGDQQVKSYFLETLPKVITRTKIAFPSRDLKSLIANAMRNTIEAGTGNAVKGALRDAYSEWTKFSKGIPINIDTLDKAIKLIPAVRSIILGKLKDKKLETALGVIDRTEKYLLRIKGKLKDIPPSEIIPIDDLLELLNKKDSRLTIVITARRDSELKDFIEVLGNNLYEERRLKGIIDPFTLFLFDEADLFIPSDGGDENTSRIRELCITLARRGRKFGLGIGIATQRASQLDTEVMGNLHTYFVSKLPRAFDRDKVAEAFGISQDQLSPTFTFRPGNWLIISHDATGLKGVPIPSIANNANQRLKEASKKYFE